MDRVYASIMYRDTTSLLSYLPRVLTFQERLIYDTFPPEIQRQVITLPTYTFSVHIEGQGVFMTIEQPTFVLPLSCGVYVLDYGEKPCGNVSEMACHYYFRVPFEDVFSMIFSVRGFVLNKRQCPKTLSEDENELFVMCALRCDPRLLRLRSFVHVKMTRVISMYQATVYVEGRNSVDDPLIRVVIRRDVSGFLYHENLPGDQAFSILVGEMHPKNETPLLS